jgi:hypothetical protein
MELAQVSAAERACKVVPGAFWIWQLQGPTHRDRGVGEETPHRFVALSGNWRSARGRFVEGITARLSLHGLARWCVWPGLAAGLLKLRACSEPSAKKGPTPQRGLKDARGKSASARIESLVSETQRETEIRDG